MHQGEWAKRLVNEPENNKRRKKYFEILQRNMELLTPHFMIFTQERKATIMRIINQESSEHSFKGCLVIFSQISASGKLEPLSSISDITFLIGSQRSSHLVASLPRAPPHQKHVHLFTTTAITSIQYYHYYLGKYPYPPPNLQQSAKERRLNQLKGEGLVSKSAEGKGEDLKSGKERGRGWIWTS